MKTIDTLISDIQEVLLKGSTLPQDGLPEKYGTLFANFLRSRYWPSEEKRRGILRMSNLGKPERQLWYEVNMPEAAEPMPPEAFMKFAFGDVIELLLLFLAEAAGHKVEGTQDEQEINGVKGHRDAVIDGMVVDAKSASSYAFKKFAEGRLEQDDPFGYVDQIQSYLFAGQTDPLVTNKDEAAFLVVDKQLGHICLDRHERKKIPYDRIVDHKRTLVQQKEPPERCFDPVPEGKSGNLALGVNCSYCAYKKTCHPGLRTFLSSRGPVYLVHVEREPKMMEISNYGDEDA